MVGEPHMRLCVVVVAGERTSVWRSVVCLPEPGFCPVVDQGTAHLMVVSPVGVEVVAGKLHRKIFWQRQGVLTTVEGFEAF